MLNLPENIISSRRNLNIGDMIEGYFITDKKVIIEPQGSGWSKDPNLLRTGVWHYTIDTGKPIGVSGALPASPIKAVLGYNPERKLDQSPLVAFRRIRGR